jgi:hedgehog protein
VLLESGVRRNIPDLNIGDLVQSVNGNGKLVFSPVILDLDTLPNHTGNFLRIHTNTGQSITLSPGHLIYRKQQEYDEVNGEEVTMLQNSICDEKRVNIMESNISAEEFSTFDIVFASLVKTNDLVLVYSSEKEIIPSQVVGVERLHLEGIYSPLTIQGNIIIDDVVVSCYADFDSHEMQHLLWTPFRLWHETIEVFPTMKNTLDEHESVDPKKTGLHWYAQFMTYVGETFVPWKMS